MADELCCDCKGAEYGNCFDCYNTGHTHPADVPCRPEPNPEVEAGLARLRAAYLEVRAERDAQQRKELDHLLSITTVGTSYQDDAPVFVTDRVREILVNAIIKDGWRRA